MWRRRRRAQLLGVAPHAGVLILLSGEASVGEIPPLRHAAEH